MIPTTHTDNERMTDLVFGTAGLRGPMREGPGGMNVAAVSRASWALAAVLRDRCLGGSTVVVGRDARHHSDEFAAATAEVLAAAGFAVVLLPDPVPTPVVAYAVRALQAVAGVQITASHNPPMDNGYKVFAEGGMQIVSPTDREVEAAMAMAPAAPDRVAVDPAGTALVHDYVARAAAVRRGTGDVRVALTAMHGVGGEMALQVLRAAGVTDVHVVAEQFAPDPDFPTVAFPNPEEPGATDLLLGLAAEVGADIAIALDPDADRCAVGIPTPGGWQMLSGDETGWLLGDYVLDHADARRERTVASTLVSSRLLAAIASAHGATHVETLTGFKWLARADGGSGALVYAYEEAIGHCVDPDAVRDKDGISAAVLACDLVAALRAEGRTVPEALDDLFRRHGVHATGAVSQRYADADGATATMARLRSAPPDRLCGAPATVADLLTRRGRDRTDALVVTAADGDHRVVIRPSGTEPKLKCYLEIRRAPAADVAAERATAAQLLEDMADEVRTWTADPTPG